jgi:hypothetical protein
MVVEIACISAAVSVAVQRETLPRVHAFRSNSPAATREISAQEIGTDWNRRSEGSMRILQGRLRKESTFAHSSRLQLKDPLVPLRLRFRFSEHHGQIYPLSRFEITVVRLSPISKKKLTILISAALFAVRTS